MVRICGLPSHFRLKPRRLQVLPGQDDYHRLGSVVQRHNWSQWFRKVQYSGCHMFCPGSYQYDLGESSLHNSMVE